MMNDELWMMNYECIVMNTKCRIWIELLYATNYLDKKEFDFLDSNCIELVKILSNIVATTKKNLNNKL